MAKTLLINTEEIQNYIKDIRKIKVITHQRQDEIFELLKNKDIPKNEKRDLLNELVVGNLRFVITVAKSYQNNGMDLIDLISEGNIGLIRAAERFDPNSGYKFISYAADKERVIIRVIKLGNLFLFTGRSTCVGSSRLQDFINISVL